MAHCLHSGRMGHHTDGDAIEGAIQNARPYDDRDVSAREKLSVFPGIVSYNIFMTVEQLNNVHHARPFRPFTIHMGDGRSFYVKHPDFLSRSPSGRTIVVHSDDDSFNILDMLLVTEFEVHASDKPNAAA
jgi:hypothetical protein